MNEAAGRTADTERAPATRRHPRSTFGLKHRAFAAVGSLVLAALGITQVAACGTLGHPSTLDRQAATTTPSRALVPTPYYNVAPVAGTAKWTYRNQRGQQLDFTVSIYHPLPLGTPKLTNLGSGYLVGDRCDYDPRTDLVVPMRIAVVLSHAQQVVAQVPFAFIFQNRGDTPYTGSGTSPSPFDNRLRLIGGVTTTGCTSRSTQALGTFANTVSVYLWRNEVNGFSGSVATQVIIKNYRTSPRAAGDPALLSWITVRPVYGATANGPTPNDFHDIQGEYPGGISKQGITLAGVTVPVRQTA